MTSCSHLAKVTVRLHERQQEEELLVHPDADIYAQLQLGLQDAGLVVSAHFGGEAIERGDRFEDLGIESGARVSAVVESIDDLTDEGYLALGEELRAELEALLG